MKKLRRVILLFFCVCICVGCQEKKEDSLEMLTIGLNGTQFHLYDKFSKLEEAGWSLVEPISVSEQVKDCILVEIKKKEMIVQIELSKSGRKKDRNWYLTGVYLTGSKTQGEVFALPGEIKEGSSPEDALKEYGNPISYRRQRADSGKTILYMEYTSIQPKTENQMETYGLEYIDGRLSNVSLQSCYFSREIKKEKKRTFDFKEITGQEFPASINILEEEDKWLQKKDMGISFDAINHLTEVSQLLSRGWTIVSKENNDALVNVYNYTLEKESAHIHLVTKDGVLETFTYQKGQTDAKWNFSTLNGKITEKTTLEKALKVLPQPVGVIFWGRHGIAMSYDVEDGSTLQLIFDEKGNPYEVTVHYKVF